MLNLSKVSTGLSNKEFFDWEKRLKQALGEDSYHAGIVLIGANDPQGLYEDKKLYKFPTPEWQKYYRKRVDTILRIFSEKKVRVYWVLLPPMGPTKYHRETRFLNEIFKEETAKLGVTCVSLETVLGDENGKYSKFLPYRGRKTLMRADDDIHLTGAGARKMSRVLMKELYKDFVFEY